MKMSSGRVFASLLSVAQLSPPSVEVCASGPPKRGAPPTAPLPPVSLGEKPPEPPVSLAEPPPLVPLLRFAPDSALQAANHSRPAAMASERAKRSVDRLGPCSATILRRV